MNNQNIQDTFNEKARVRSGRVAMTRGGPRQRYSGGHNGPEGQEKAAALAQESGSDASSDSESDVEEVKPKKPQALQQSKKQIKQQAQEESSSDSSSSDSDSD